MLSFENKHYTHVLRLRSSRPICGCGKREGILTYLVHVEYMLHLILMNKHDIGSLEKSSVVKQHLRSVLRQHMRFLSRVLMRAQTRDKITLKSQV